MSSNPGKPRRRRFSRLLFVVLVYLLLLVVSHVVRRTGEQPPPVRSMPFVETQGVRGERLTDDTVDVAYRELGPQRSGTSTAVLLLRGGPGVGYHLSVLGNYLPGFTVSWAGAAIGFVEAAVVGFLHGWLIGKLVNAVVGREERRLRTLIAASSASPDSIARGDSE